MRKIITKISAFLDRTCCATAVAFFTAMLILVAFQVVARYVFWAVPVWTEEAARYCMVWGGFLGAAVAFRANADPLLIKPPTTGPPAWIISARWLRAFATVVFLGPVLYHSGPFLQRTWYRTTNALGIPTAFVTVAVPLSIAVIFFHLIARLVDPAESQESEVNSEDKNVA
jgi:TRAP-type C4-dicarboxylate transport system permease small subunit